MFVHRDLHEVLAGLIVNSEWPLPTVFLSQGERCPAGERTMGLGVLSLPLLLESTALCGILLEMGTQLQLSRNWRNSPASMGLLCYCTPVLGRGLPAPSVTGHPSDLVWESSRGQECRENL